MLRLRLRLPPERLSKFSLPCKSLCQRFYIILSSFMLLEYFSPILRYLPALSFPSSGPPAPFPFIPFLFIYHQSMATPAFTTVPPSQTVFAIIIGSKWDPTLFVIVVLVPLLPLMELFAAYLWLRRRNFGKYIQYPHMSYRQRMKRRSYGDDYDYDDEEETYTRTPWRPTQSQGSQGTYPSTDETLTRRVSTSSTYAYGYGSSRFHGATNSVGSTSTTSHYVTSSPLNHRHPTSTSPRSSPQFQPPYSPSNSSTPTNSIIQPRPRDSSLPFPYKQSIQTTSVSESSRTTSPSTPISPASSSKQQMVIPIIAVSSHDDENEDGVAQGAVVLDFGGPEDDEHETAEGEYYSDEEGVVDTTQFRGADVLSDITEEGSLPSSVSTLPSFAPITELSHPQALYHRVQRIEPWTP
jgi:hypothetical protein